MKQTKILFASEIPDSWTLIPNRYLFYKNSEKVGDNSSQYQLLSLTTEGVKEKDINSSGGKVPTSYDNYQTVEKNDMILCLFDLDCSAVFSGMSKYNGMITSAYDVLKTNPNYINADYIQYWFSYIFSNRYYKMYSKNIRYSITMDVFNAIQTPLPSLKEQSRISSFLDEKCLEINSLINLQDAIIGKLQEYKQSVIMEAVTRGLDPSIPMKDSNIEWIGMIPNHWELKRVKYVLDERKEYSINGSEEPLSMSQVYGIIPSKKLNIPNPATSYVGAKLVHNGDLVFNKLKAYLGVFAQSQYNGLVSPDYAVYFGLENCYVKYLEYLFKTPKYINEFKKYITGVGAGLSRLYTPDLFNISLAMPTYEEQYQIADYLDCKCSEIDSLIDLKKQKIETLKEYKKSLIYECVTGKKEVA